MGYALISVGNTANIPVQSIYCDTDEDLNNIPVGGIPVGSVAYIIKNGKMFMLNSSKTWVKQPGLGITPAEYALVDHDHKLEDITDLNIDEYVRDEIFQPFSEDVIESVIVAGIATEGNDTTLVDSQATFAVDSLSGMTIKVLIEDKVYHQQIIANTSTEIIFETLPDEAKVVEGTNYIIVHMMPKILQQMSNAEGNFQELFDRATAIVLPEETDLNNITAWGLYELIQFDPEDDGEGNIIPAAQYENSPEEDITGLLRVNRSREFNTITQEIIYAGNVYSRISQAGVWSPWVRYAPYQHDHEALTRLESVVLVEKEGEIGSEKDVVIFQPEELYLKLGSMDRTTLRNYISSIIDELRPLEEEEPEDFT